MSVIVVFDHSRSILDSIRHELEAAVGDSAQAIQSEARRKVIDGPKTGRIHLSRTKPSPHQASAPGEAPANWTGNLAEHVEMQHQGLEAEVSIDPNAVPYAEGLEHGSADGTRAPRPFFYPSVMEEADRLPDRAAAAVKRVTG